MFVSLSWGMAVLSVSVYAALLWGGSTFFLDAVVLLNVPVMLAPTRLFGASTRNGRRAILTHCRCAFCGYGMVTEPEPDGCTVCSECGGAWQLPDNARPFNDPQGP